MGDVKRFAWTPHAMGHDDEKGRWINVEDHDHVTLELASAIAQRDSALAVSDDLTDRLLVAQGLATFRKYHWEAADERLVKVTVERDEAVFNLAANISTGAKVLELQTECIAMKADRDALLEALRAIAAVTCDPEIEDILAKAFSAHEAKQPCNETFHRLGGIDDCDPCLARAARGEGKL